MADKDHVIRIKPNYYIHVLDNNTNVTHLICGPATFTRKDHERLVSAPEPMVMVPQRHFCTIANPVLRNAKDGKVVTGPTGALLRHGDEEIRLHTAEPFPLFPGEQLVGKVTPLQVVHPNTALRIRCSRPFVDSEVGPNGKPRQVQRDPGDEWLFTGSTYMPKVEETVLELVTAVTIKNNQALRLRALRKTNDVAGQPREAGEEWLVRQVGSYLPGINEKVVGTVTAQVLTDKVALHIKALRTFVDVFKTKRRAGEEWLVTASQCDTYIPDVSEQLVGTVRLTTLTSRHYCVLVNPVHAGVIQFGKRKLVKGPATFFLLPGEQIEGGRPQNVYVLRAEEALLVQAIDAFKEDEKTTRRPGDRWLLHGPCDFVPPIEVQVVETRTTIPLDKNEGIYVRDIRSGKVRAVVGQSYMLQPYEELWEKSLPSIVEQLLTRVSRDSDTTANKAAAASSSSAKKRDPTRVVVYRAPHNSAVQVYDFKSKLARVVFGPELVLLGPDEQFTVLNMSGGTPKREGVIQCLALFLGPDFMTDEVRVETADHARLKLKLSYSWEFDINAEKATMDQATALFSVPDFVGDTCKALASRVRAAAAARTFDDFHKSSADIIRSSVFGIDKKSGLPKNLMRFGANNLLVRNIDIQSVEPADPKTLESLQKSVQLAIDITTRSQETGAKHDADRLKQIAKGKLDRQMILDQAESERAKKTLLELRAESNAIQSTGVETAKARAIAEARAIAGQAEVKQAQLQAEAATIEASVRLEQLKSRHAAELEHLAALDELEITKKKELAKIESKKFADIVKVMGKETIKNIAKAGPEMQARLLKGLGLEGYMIVDGSNPINLFQTANGMIASANGQIAH